MPLRRRIFRLDVEALRLARVAPDATLCLAPGAWGSTFALEDSPPPSPTPGPGRVAVVDICGPLAQEADQLCGWYDGYEGSTGIAARVTAALRDPSISAVVLRFDSPGGVISGLEECVRRICEARDDMQKPVVAHVGETCASAAYWLAACCASEIHGPAASYTGAIGCYRVHLDESGALDQEGLKVTLVADPPGKVAGSPHEPLSELARSRLDRDVKAVTARFVEAVTAARGMAPEAIRALDGDLLQAGAAVEAGLIDGLGSLEDVVALAAALAGDPPPERAAPEQPDQEIDPMPPKTPSSAAEAAALHQLANLGRHVMTITGAASPEAARGVLDASLRDAGDVAELRARLARAEASAELSERIALLEQGIRERKIKPAEAWAYGVESGGDGKERKVRKLSAWASAPHTDPEGRQLGQTLDQLRNYLVHKVPDARGPDESEPSTQGHAPEADASERATRIGVKPESYKRAQVLVEQALRTG